MRATVKTALSALLMLLLAVSSANATTCLRVSDNEQFELEFYRDLEETGGIKVNYLHLRGDDKTYGAQIIDSNLAMVVAAEVDWKLSTIGYLHVTTYYFDRLNRRIRMYSSHLPQTQYTIEKVPRTEKIPPSIMAEFLCTKAQN